MCCAANSTATDHLVAGGALEHNPALSGWMRVGEARQDLHEVNLELKAGSAEGRLLAAEMQPWATRVCKGLPPLNSGEARGNRRRSLRQGFHQLVPGSDADKCVGVDRDEPLRALGRCSPKLQLDQEEFLMRLENSIRSFQRRGLAEHSSGCELQSLEQCVDDRFTAGADRKKKGNGTSPEITLPPLRQVHGTVT
jgi:hypothetical protein